MTREPAVNRKWALGRGASETWRRLREGWAALPSGNAARWGMTVVVGFFLACLLTWGMTSMGRRLEPGYLREWDERALRRIEAGLMSFPDAILAESPGNLSYLIPLTAVAAVVAARARRPMLAITFLAGYVMARPLIFLGWSLWDRSRPKLIAGGVAAPGFHSYPSGHVILAIVVYGLIAYLWCAASRSILERVVVWLVFMIWIAMIGWARLRLGTHWPSDVLAGAVIGLMWMGVMIVALRRGERVVRGAGS